MWKDAWKQTSLFWCIQLFGHRFYHDQQLFFVVSTFLLVDLLFSIQFAQVRAKDARNWVRVSDFNWSKDLRKTKMSPGCLQKFSLISSWSSHLGEREKSVHFGVLKFLFFFRVFPVWDCPCHRYCAQVGCPLNKKLGSTTLNFSPLRQCLHIEAQLF